MTVTIPPERDLDKKDPQGKPDPVVQAYKDALEKIRKAYEDQAKLPVPANTYELALVLGGTVSAGAYTAGVLDFLLEALEEWEKAKQLQAKPSAKKTVPTHKLMVKVVAGASGGGVNGAIFAKVATNGFPHVTPVSANAVRMRNPFYNTWVSKLDVAGFTDTSDLKGNRVVESLLCPAPIDSAALAIASFAGDRVDRQGYLADPLELILTLTNLRGMPYTVAFSGAAKGQYFTDHADHVRFAIGLDTASKPKAPREAAGDSFLVVAEPGNAGDLHQIDWEEFSLFARATGAFPAGFPARKLRRPLEHYLWRPAVLPGEQGGPRVVLRTPVFDLLRDQRGVLPQDYEFVAVDGGGTDNQPVELARTALAGVTGRNPRNATEANRGVLLVDPFADMPTFDSTDITTQLLSAGLQTVGSLVGQARYSTSDLLLALDETVFSRFMITPVREDGDAPPWSGRKPLPAPVSAPSWASWTRRFAATTTSWDARTARIT
ncbi:hypothetical protein HHL28_15865 [Aerophototrophica crusticola]|uniref:PNPLA domain-containing protein n=1 Tax=Aerophototrophica crusticola TaxID=1709002 RepID=A0A858RB52_9PROT|nr:hypothetical protein HHL28_15865 [Rhodospirillaceae bacterium B3]